jgi:hypothetical protein
MVSKYNIRLPGSFQLADNRIDNNHMVLEQQKEETGFDVSYHNALLK